MSGNNEEPITTTTEANPLSTQQQQETKNAPDAVAPLSAESIKQINVDPNAEVPIDYQDSEEDDDGLGVASPGAKTRRSETIDVFKSKGGIKLTWSHLTYKVKTTEGKPKTIISNLSGNALPGRFLAILGPSGGGKSSLTNAITGRLIMPEDSRLDGVVYLNDIVLHEKHKPIVSFVCQDDIVMPKETPLDAFRFSASIRNEKLSAEELELRANDMIRDLKLTSCKDTIMGVPGILKGLSGGEKRRTNIGVELINNPPIVILDEPTSGLDSVAAFRIGKLMRALAHQEGRTVIATIHSPSSELFQLFDDLLLLAKGEVVYHGPAQGLRDYLEAIGRPMPKNVNPCEFAMKLLQSTAEELEGYKDAWKRCAESIQPGVYARIHTEYIDSFEADLAKKEEGKTAGQQQQEMTAKVAVANHDEYSAGEALAPIKNPMDPIFASRFGAEVARCLAPPPQKINESNEIVEKLLAERQPPSLPHQFKLVAARSWRNVVRDPMLTVGRVAQTVIFAVFIGLVYLNLKVDSDGVQDRLGLCFLLMIQTIFLSMMPALMAFPPELAVYLQDQANGMYGPGAFYWAKAFVELPINTIVPLLFCVIIYFMAQLGQTAEQFFRFFCTILVNGYCANGLGMFLGAFAGRKPEAAFVYAPLVVMPLAFVAGLFANTDRLEPGWVWLEWVSFPRYVFKNLIRIEFLPMGTICKPGVDKNCRYPTGEDVVNFLGFDQFKFDEFGFNILMICIIMMFFRLLGMAGLYYQAASQHAKLVFKENHERVAKLIGSK